MYTLTNSAGVSVTLTEDELYTLSMHVEDNEEEGGLIFQKLQEVRNNG